MPQHDFSKPRKPIEAPIVEIQKGGEAVVVVTGPIRGGHIQNPSMASESLFIDLVNTPRSTAENARRTTIELRPGEGFTFPFLQSTVQLKANAATAGHKFNAVIW